MEYTCGMRILVALVFVLSLGTTVFADALPDCPEGQMPDCSPSERSHGCGGCVDDPSYEGSGCAAAGAAGFSSSAALLIALVLRRRED